MATRLTRKTVAQALAERDRCTPRRLALTLFLAMFPADRGSRQP